MAARPATSSIAMALAGKTPSVDIPKSRDTRRTYPASADLDLLPGQPALLPTPPSSISPALHPHGFKHRACKMPDSPPLIPEHVDSDIDLQDAVQLRGPAAKLVPEALHSLDSAEAITPALLAKQHLPDILLNHGPLAIRHIMGYLTTSVPGFSSIAPAKARRLVVGALEGKGVMGEGGGITGEVEFEKVGWGRWDAKRRGAVRNRPVGVLSPPCHPMSHLRQVSRGSTDFSLKEEHHRYGSSFAGESAVFSHSEWGYGDQTDQSLAEHEADKMSLDGDDRAYCSSLQASDDDELMHGDWEEADVTDEEDWAQIGAAALRARFTSSGGEAYSPTRSKGGSGGGPSLSTLAKSVPGRFPIQNVGFSFSDGIGGSFEERAAVEALLQMGSM